MKHTKILSIILFLSGFLLNKAFADETLLWQDCVKEAKNNPPDLVSALEKIHQAKATKEITRSAYLPQLGFDASEVTAKRPSFGVSGSSVQLVSSSSNAPANTSLRMIVS